MDGREVSIFRAVLQHGSCSIVSIFNMKNDSQLLVNQMLDILLNRNSMGPSEMF